MSNVERHEQPDRQRSLQDLTAREADRRGHVLARLSDVYVAALSDHERYIGHDILLTSEGEGEEVNIFRMDSVYPVLREDYVVEPNHLTLFIPATEVPSNPTRFSAEWDLKRQGKYSHIVDSEGARTFERQASKRIAEERDQRTRLEQELANLELGQTDISTVEQAIDGLYDSVDVSIEILDQFYTALTSDYRLVPYQQNKLY